jgi:pyrimidine and pyridine-specific 5'-nucleotidase
MIKFDPDLVKLFEDIDRSNVRIWALTNAYKLHAQRVLRILGIEHLIDGLFYCDYQAKELICKPEPEYYHRAMQQAGITDPSKCYFIDDSLKNVTAAYALGWSHCVHFCEKGHEVVHGGRVMKISGEVSNGTAGPIQGITDLQQLRELWPEIFKSQ